ncbi:Noc2-domain-containing protein [Stereum hirsutum FP-91666 SS1]|uniref:Noc2-domain-containing protein n=1 Tax=Stereum hirsutum (strain FP-91666) TaxID=721885 RepID=UPI000444A8E6|nr:Noc2-domain-containing protein [Stereum hirsutum FP-91666 SS1]EIM84277.1 Noc2-domain-containing protein [Stereum hirsutum FP-91666 SS1]
MAKKGAKATRKFAASGQLKKQIQARHKHQQLKKNIERRKGGKAGRGASGYGKGRGEDGEEDDGDEDRDAKGKSKKAKMSVDDILGGSFMAEDDDEEGGIDSDSEMDEAEDEEGEEDDDDDQSFASVDALDEDGATHLDELSKLAEKDPEFYKYLQENDRELLDFDPNAVDQDSDEEAEGEDADMDVEEDKAPVLTSQILKKWQKALLEQRSLRALRKLLIAFRAAAHMNEEDQVLAWTIDSASVYSKLITTALRYTPIILSHHVPYKTLPNGKMKAPAQSHKLKTLQKLILSYFHNVMHVISQLSEPEMVKLAVTESSKLLPYVVSSRKTVKLYLRSCLELWSTAEDTVRIAAFLAIRKLASATDESILDMVLKSTYLTLIRSSKSTGPHTLPSINLMKNSASEIFCMDHGAAYQHAFGYIRQLAIHLRNSMKIKSKESFKQVYNWQFVHSIDFWAHVLARACDVQSLTESPLKPLIYPLVQVATGAIRLMSNSRCYPFHFHLLRSLIHLSSHTNTYIPLAPHLLPILTSLLAPSSTKLKSSTLRPLPFETTIRAPQQYIHTKVYHEGLADEATFLLAEWLCCPAVGGSVAFPEVVVPLTVVLRKALKVSRNMSSAGGPGGKGKKGGNAKEAGIVKGLVERIEENAKWVEKKREGVSFAPNQTGEVEGWERDLREKIGEGPLGKYLKVLTKAREKRAKLIEKAREGEDEILNESNDDEDEEE